jgi:hypothetical protein
MARNRKIAMALAKIPTAAQAKMRFVGIEVMLAGIIESLLDALE